jgi:hypothetical protein
VPRHPGDCAYHAFRLDPAARWVSRQHNVARVPSDSITASGSSMYEPQTYLLSQRQIKFGWRLRGTSQPLAGFKEQKCLWADSIHANLLEVSPECCVELFHQFLGDRRIGDVSTIPSRTMFFPH